LIFAAHRSCYKNLTNAAALLKFAAAKNLQLSRIAAIKKFDTPKGVIIFLFWKIKLKFVFWQVIRHTYNFLLLFS
jgi:hypothetical protein